MKSIIIYLVLCIISALAGRGILRLIGVRLERRISLYLAPIITLTFWTIMLGVGVSLGFPIKDFWVVGWLLTLAMAFIGLWREDYRFLQQEWMWLAGVCLLPMALMAAYFRHGLATYLGSLHPDGWSYIAQGQYVWTYSQGTEGGLAPLYQYAAHLNRTRFIASALLGFFSPLAGKSGDTQAASGYFLAWTFFVYASTCMFFAVAKGLGKQLLVFYVSISVFSGWLLNLLSVNNYANALAISFLPAFAGLIHLADPQDRRWLIVLAGLAAASLYCYPEMALFVLGGAGLFLLGRTLSGGKALLAWLILLLGTTALATFLIAPFLHNLTWYFLNQFKMAMMHKEVRDGESLFRELLIPQERLVAFWGLGGEAFADGRLMGGAWHYGRTLLALVLSTLAGLGILELFRRKDWGLATTIVLLFVGSLVMIFLSAYSYGAYKFILLDWWGISFAVIMGIRFLNKILHTKMSRSVVRACLIISFGFLLSLNGYKALAFGWKASEKSIVPFKQVETIKEMVGNEAILVAVNDGTGQKWAVYFLRDVPIVLAEYKDYMAQSHVVPLMDRAKSIGLSDVHYILTDRIGSFSFPHRSPLWTNRVSALWKLPGEHWIVVSGLQNANGIEDWGGEGGFWLGQGDTEIRLLSAKAGWVVMRAHFIRGPSLPEKLDRQILVFTNRGYNSTMTIAEDGPHTIVVPVVAGRNRLVLRPLEQPSLPVLPNGDTRPLLLGIRGLKVSLAETDPLPDNQDQPYSGRNHAD